MEIRDFVPSRYLSTTVMRRFDDSAYSTACNQPFHGVPRPFRCLDNITILGLKPPNSLVVTSNSHKALRLGCHHGSWPAAGHGVVSHV